MTIEGKTSIVTKATYEIHTINRNQHEKIYSFVRQERVYLFYTAFAERLLCSLSNKNKKHLNNCHEEAEEKKQLKTI